MQLREGLSAPSKSTLLFSSSYGYVWYIFFVFVYINIHFANICIYKVFAPKLLTAPHFYMKISALALRPFTAHLLSASSSHLPITLQANWAICYSENVSCSFNSFPLCTCSSFFLKRAYPLWDVKLLQSLAETPPSPEAFLCLPLLSLMYLVKDMQMKASAWTIAATCWLNWVTAN